MREEAITVLKPLFPRPTDESPDPGADGASGSGGRAVRMYRGQPVAEREPREGKRAGKPRADKDKPVRYYRGQRVRDD